MTQQTTRALTRVRQTRRPARRALPLDAGFTLVELMVALALAALLTMTIMVVSNSAREIQVQTVRKVELSNRFRLALLTLDRDFSQWIATSNMEFFVDGVGAGARRNIHWDEGEEIPDKNDALGPGVVDGGMYNEYDEFASITERHYWAIAPGNDPSDESNRKLHSAFQAYFRTITYIDGRVREANVEYMLVDPNNLDARGNPRPPKFVVGEKLADLRLIKVVRYHNIDSQAIEQRSRTFDIHRRVVEVASNVTDFEIEYTVENPFTTKVGIDFRTPREEYRDPIEREVRPEMIPSGDAEHPLYRKVFGYGSAKIDKSYAKAIAFKALQGDRQLQQDHRPVRVGWQQNSDIQFAELVQGSRIFIFTDSNRGAAAAAGAAGGIARANRFPSDTYTVKANLGGRLEFYQDIDSSSWEGDQPALNYKAAFLPSALRVTLRVVDDKGANPRTMQRLIWIRRKAR